MLNVPVIGLDVSLTCTAVVFKGIYGDPECKLCESSAQGTGIEDRFARYEVLLTKILDATSGFGHALIVLEGYSHGSKNQAHFLGEFGGMLRRKLLKAGHKVIEVPPQSLKKFVTGKGAGDKTATIATLAQKFQVNWSKNDAYDALGCWWYGQIFTGQMEGLARQKEMMVKPAKVKAPKTQKGARHRV